MKLFTVLAASALAISAASAGQAATGPLTAFANFSPLNGQAYDFAYNSSTRTLYTSNNATGSSIGTVGAVGVNFQYLLGGDKLAVVNAALAANPGVVSFQLVAVASKPAYALGTTAEDDVLRSEMGFNTTFTYQSFKFTLNSAIEVGGFTCSAGGTNCHSATASDPIPAGGYHHTGYIYAAGTNLLSGTFQNASLTGDDDGTTAAFSGSTGRQLTTAGATNPNYKPNNVVFSSDLLDFTSPPNPSVERDFSIALNSLSPSFGGPTVTTSGQQTSIYSFSALATGNFASNPPPRVTAIPETATWGMLIIGFGMVGGVARKRRRTLAAA